MKLSARTFQVKDKSYTIRAAEQKDAKTLSKIRWQIDGETQNLDREQGEAFLDEQDFAQLIETDTIQEKNLFLVAVVDEEVIAFSRCEGNRLKRFSHKVEFGVGVLQGHWGYGIGKNLLKESIDWCDSNGIRKITLTVLESNQKAIVLYKKYGFKTEGVLKNDKLFTDGKFHNTVVMGRFK